MKRTFIFFTLFLVFTFYTVQSQNKLPIVMMAPDISFADDCSDKKKIALAVKNQMADLKKKYSSVINAVSFSILEAITWDALARKNCIEKKVTDAKIKSIANGIKDIPNEVVLIFFSRFGFTPSFAVDTAILYSTHELDNILKDATDKFLISVRNETKMIHSEAIFAVAKFLSKDPQNCETVCALIDQLPGWYKAMGSFDYENVKEVTKTCCLKVEEEGKEN